VLYELAAVSLLDASLHASDETGLVLKHPGNGVFHQLLGVFTVGRGQLLEPRFDVGREMYFHAFKVRENYRRGNRRRRRSLFFASSAPLREPTYFPALNRFSASAQFTTFHHAAM
jgi:hypothetical protein